MNQGRNSFFDNIPPVVKNLLILNMLIWLLCITNLKYHLLGSFDIYDTLSLHYWESKDFLPIQLFSYMFLHDFSSFWHVLFNMFNLYMFGCIMEHYWGSKRFLIFYVVCGVGAALTQEAVWSLQFFDMDTPSLIVKYRPDLIGINQMISNGHLVHSFTSADGYVINSVSELRSILLNTYTTIGASGAIFGVMLAFGMTFPNMPLFFMFIPIPVKAKYMIGFFALAEIFFGVTGRMDNVAHFAHLGGMLFGILLILKWRHDKGNNDFSSNF